MCVTIVVVSIFIISLLYLFLFHFRVCCLFLILFFCSLFLSCLDVALLLVSTPSCTDVYVIRRCKMDMGLVKILPCLALPCLGAFLHLAVGLAGGCTANSFTPSSRNAATHTYTHNNKTKQTNRERARAEQHPLPLLREEGKGKERGARKIGRTDEGNNARTIYVMDKSHSNIIMYNTIT